GVLAIQVAKYAFHRNPVEADRARGYSDIIPKPLTRNVKMHIACHMEAILIAAIVIIGAAGFAAAAVPAQHAGAVAVTVAPGAVTAVAGKMQVVTIVGKRLSAAEKAQLGG
ncbi:MAG: hypothetical protein JWR40_249, partial [Massilia sp.]|nr:hypothetical protein [Massilia sp.]